MRAIQPENKDLNELAPLINFEAGYQKEALQELENAEYDEEEPGEGEPAEEGEGKDEI